MVPTPTLQGKLIVQAQIKVLTGLRIGGAAGGLEIGGLDNPVIRDPVTQRPYIPGSSLKGKMRSLVTRALGKELEELVQGRVRIHWCEPDEYWTDGVPCPVCRTFGTAGERAQEPGRLIVRDAPLLDELEVPDENGGTRRVRWDEIAAGLDLPYTEVKMEAAIDVITAAANPRQMERVPPGALFDAEMLLAVYDQHDREALRTLLLGMRLLEDDYLGSSGSRGYGRIRFQNVRVLWRSVDHYRDPEHHPEQVLAQADTLADLWNQFDRIAKQVWKEE